MTKLDGTAFDLRELRGNWVFVMVDSGDCDKRCEDKLLMMRQQRTMTGKDRDQIERVWLIPDQVPLSIMLMREFEGTHFIRRRCNRYGIFLRCLTLRMRGYKTISGSSIRAAI